MALAWAVDPSAFNVPVAQSPLPPLLPAPLEPLLLLLLDPQAASASAAAVVVATSHTRFSFTWQFPSI
jgi:hypothetical protein